MRYFILDTETTGLGTNAEAWEVAVICCDETGKQLTSFHNTCKPQVAWEEKAMQMSGLQDYQLDSFQSPDKLLNQVTAFIKANAEPNKWDNTIVCHNVAYDMPLLARMYDKYIGKQDFRDYVGYADICTMQTLRMLKAAGIWKHSCKLEETHKQLGTLDDAHTALADAEATAELFFQLKDRLSDRLKKNWFDRLIDWFRK